MASQACENPQPDWFPEAQQTAAQAFRWALQAGVPIAMGTDCPMMPHERRLEELGHMHRLGMAPPDVWRAATYDAARLLDRDDIGLLEPGRRADIVALRGQVTSLDDLDERIAWVRKDGQLVPAGG